MKNVQQLLQQYTQGVFQIYGTTLKAVILFGSYARGDFNSDSDIDIMILLNASEKEILETKEQISDYTYDFNMEYDVDIMPVIKGIDQFNYWRTVYPFYQNIEREGVELYVS